MIYSPKTPAFYLHDEIFWIKMTLFLAVGLVSIAPTMHFIRLSRATPDAGVVIIEERTYATIRRLLEEYILERERSLGYQHVYTPDLAKVELYERSGHWAHYQGSMFPPMDLETERMVLRPMNCPHHILVYE